VARRSRQEFRSRVAAVALALIAALPLTAASARAVSAGPATMAPPVPPVPVPTLPIAGPPTSQPSSECRLPAEPDDPTNVTAGNIDFSLYKRPIGTVKALMLFLDFSDAPGGSSTAATQHIFDGAADWLKTSSYGRVDLQITTVSRWIRMPHPSTYYPFQRGLTYEDHVNYVRDAVRAADPTVNFAGYDLYYFVANPDAAAISFSPTFIWGSDSPVRADGVAITRGTTFGADVTYWGYKILDHETSHIFGLPDLYLEGASSNAAQFQFTGGWDIEGDILGQSPDHLSLLKWNLGWLDDSQVACYDIATEGDVDLAPLETVGGLKAVIFRTGATTATVAEYRTRNGEDSGACDTGVLIYKVDTSIPTLSGPIRVVDAHPTAPLPAGCESKLDDAAFGPTDNSYVDATNGITIKVDSLGDTAHLTVVRTQTWTPPDLVRTRTLTIRSSSPLGEQTVTFTSRLSASPTDSLCTVGRSVKLERWNGEAWVVVRTANTTSASTWSFTFSAPPTRYRFVAGSQIVGSRPRHVCGLAVSPILTLK
jgi:M6 family metalloprotease-like protein